MTDFEKMFNDNRSFIFRYLLKLCKNQSLAEELTQETFFRAYMNMITLKHEDRAPVWLCRIAKNTYFAWYNEHKKLCPLDEKMISDCCVEPDELFAEKELTEKALHCLSCLKEPYKEVLMLYIFGQVSLKEISETFGKSESWARVTFYRAKQKLIEKMR